MSQRGTGPTLHNASELPPPLGHYSHVAVAGGLAFVSGQLPVDATGTPLVDASVQTQLQQTLVNLDACLRAVGCARLDLVQVRLYLTSIADWTAVDAVYQEWVGEHRPARAVAGVKGLHFGAKVEIEAVAIIPARVDERRS